MYGRPSMLRRELVQAWQFRPGVDRELAERIVMDRLDDPDTYVVVLSSGRGWIRAQVVSGELPATGALLLLDRHGIFEVSRRDDWVPRTEGKSPRVLLFLSALPSTDELTTQR